MPSFSERLDDFLVRNIAYFNYKNYVKRIDLQGDEKLLEVGCGGGNLSRFLAKILAQGRLVCIDNSEYWLEKSKKRLKQYKNIKFELTNILNFNKENYFDMVVVNYVLHDIMSEKREKAIEILSKSLKEKGRVYIREPTRESHGISSDEIRDLMLKEGFSEKTSREKYFFPLKGKVYEGIFRKILF